MSRRPSAASARAARAGTGRRCRTAGSRRRTPRRPRSTRCPSSVPSRSTDPRTRPGTARRRRSLVGVEAAPVGVREQDVVVDGQEAGRGGRVRVGARRVVHVQQLPAALVAERPQPRAQPLEHGPHRRQAATRPARSAGSRARTRRGSAGRCASGSGRAASGRPSHASASARVTCRALPQTPRGGTCTSGRWLRHRYASAPGVRSGKWRASSARSSGMVRGSARKGRATSRTGAGSTVASSSLYCWWTVSSRSRMGCTGGRSSRQSSAVTRWMVPRIRTIRTASRSVSSAASAAGRNPRSR